MENNEYVKYGADDERSAQRQASARRTAKRIAQQAYHGMRYYLDRDCGVADIDDDESDYRYIDEDILGIFAENCRIRPKRHGTNTLTSSIGKQETLLKTLRSQPCTQ